MIMQKKKMPASVLAAQGEEDKLNAEIRRKTRLIKQLKHDALIKIAVSAAIAFITFGCVFGVTLAPTNDMFPAVHEGDLILFYRPGRIIKTDVVIYETTEGMQIGRIEGTEGETVGKTDGGLLTVNGNIQPVQKRSGLYDETYAGDKDISGEISRGDYLILGDRRETAEDSRTYGLISRKAIKGKVFTIIRRRPL
jgi:signal peptidase I